MFSERTQVLLSPEQLGRLKRIAERDRKSVGAVIREAVDAFIDRRPCLARRGRSNDQFDGASRGGLGGHEGPHPEQPAGRLVTVFVDTSVVMYAAGGDHPLREPCRRIIDRIADGSIDAVTSAEVDPGDPPSIPGDGTCRRRSDARRTNPGSVRAGPSHHPRTDARAPRRSRAGIRVSRRVTSSTSRHACTKGSRTSSRPIARSTPSPRSADSTRPSSEREPA